MKKPASKCANIIRKKLGERRSNQAAVLIYERIDNVLAGELSRKPGMARLKDGSGFAFVRG